MRPHSVLRRTRAEDDAPLLTLSVVGGDGNVYWLINGRPVRQTAAQQKFQYRFDESGTYDITALDQLGNYDSVSIKVVQ